MCVRSGVLSSTIRRVHDIRQCLYATSVKKIYVALKESVAIAHSTNVGLAIECLGVRVATVDVKMMGRKFATSGFPISRSARNASSHGLCRAFSFFGILTHQYDVLLLSSTWSILVVRCFEQFLDFWQKWIAKEQPMRGTARTTMIHVCSSTGCPSIKFHHANCVESGLSYALFLEQNGAPRTRTPWRRPRRLSHHWFPDSHQL